MKVEDLRSVKVGDILICLKHNAKFKVREIDLEEPVVPIRVEHIEDGLRLTSDYQIFAEEPVQWLYTTPEDFEDEPTDNMITLEDLEPFNRHTNTKQTNFKMSSASEIVEYCKSKLMEEVEKRIKSALVEKVVWSVEIKDLDIHPIKKELEELGYDVDVFSNGTVLSWEEE